MNFTLFSWYKPAILLISIASCYVSKPLPSLAEEAKSINVSINYNHIQINYPENQGWTSKDESRCKELNSIYEDFYSFETDNYYISICQLESNFYYNRQSKLNVRNNLLIPAQAVFDGNVFQATDGKITYLVGQDGDRYYSSVILNNNEIVFEPELRPTSIAFSQKIVDRGVSFSFSDLRLNNLGSTGNNNWALNRDRP